MISKLFKCFFYFLFYEDEKESKTTHSHKEKRKQQTVAYSGRRVPESGCDEIGLHVLIQAKYAARGHLFFFLMK